MHIPTHILSGWCTGNLFDFKPRERLFCMIAATAADLDGLGMIYSMDGRLIASTAQEGLIRLRNGSGDGV